MSTNSTISTTSNEADTSSDCGSLPSAPELADLSGQPSDSTDSDSDSDSENLSSPASSLFGERPYELDLKGPEPGEEPQSRGRLAHTLGQSPPINPPGPAPAPHVVPPPNRAGGANHRVVQGPAPFNPPEALPEPPEHH
ncbi:hypothetical protein OPQ81_001335 [Rhizoctonia solani]|nr:hypothetical protein OPQ81_001335 [Rhizoctonia solani]